MRRSVFFVFIVLGAILPLNLLAQVGEWMKFTDTTHVFGNISEDEGPVSYDFEFINAGPDNIQLKDVKPSCGCTTPDWTRDVVHPGEKGYIKVQFNPQNRPGPFKKSLKVTANVGNLTLFIEGNVVPKPKSPEEEYPVQLGALRVKHGRLNLGKMVTNKPVVRSFAWYNEGDKPITFEMPENLPPYLKVQIIPLRLDPEEMGNLVISFDPVLKNAFGNHIELFVINTDDELMPEKQFDLISTIYEYFSPVTDDEYATLPQIEIDELAHDLGDVQEGDIAVHEFQITNKGGEVLNLRALIANCNCVKVKASKNNIQPGETVALKVAFDTDNRKGTQHKLVTIHSNDPRNSAINVTLKSSVKSDD